MTWTRLDDDFNDRPENYRLGRSARLLKVEALVWCNKVLSDGVVPEHMLSKITDSEDPVGDVTELVDGGHWTRLESGDGWQVDWSSQEPAEVVEQRREDHNARQRKYNERRRLHGQGDHSMCDPQRCRAGRGDASRDAAGDTSRDGSDDGLPSRPVPSRPLGRDRDREGGSASSGGSAPLAASSTPPPRPTWEQPPSGAVIHVDGQIIGTVP